MRAKCHPALPRAKHCYQQNSTGMGLHLGGQVERPLRHDRPNGGKERVAGGPRAGIGNRARYNLSPEQPAPLGKQGCHVVLIRA